MVRSEEGNTIKTEAQLISKSSCANEGSRELERKEKEIVRSLMIAERDKRESMITLEQIKKLNDQYQALIDDFYNGQDKEEVSFDLALPPTSDIIEKRRKSVSGCENQSPNISPPATPPLMAHSLQENYAEMLRTKDVELRRVAARAREESQRAALLAKKKEELQKRLLDEVNKWRGTIKEVKQGIDFKEREIVRLSFLAEQDKKSCMFLSQQVAQLKKSLEGFLQAHEDEPSKPESLCKIMGRCTSSSDLLSSPPASPLLHHTARPTRHPSSSGGMTKRTPLGRELEASFREDEKKTIELARVKSIAEQEAKRLEALKEKVEELKQGLVMELQEADEQLGQKMQLFMQKQQAIEKVAARAERERSRSMFLKEEIIKLTNALGNGGASKDATPKKKSKTPEYGPDVAYLSEFSELCDLENPSNHSSSLPLAIVRNLQTPSDPAQYIFSPPCRSIPISPASECIYMQKLKDIAVLNRETSKKDEELVRLKKLAEAERCRHLLLKDKFEELRTEMREKELQSGRTV